MGKDFEKLTVRQHLAEMHGFEPISATPEVVGAYLAAGWRRLCGLTLRRRVAAIACACGVAELDTKHLAIATGVGWDGCDTTTGTCSTAQTDAGRTGNRSVG